MSLDRFLTRRRRPDYWCGDLARDVWLELSGNDLNRAVADLLARDAVGRLRRRHVAAFREHSGPVDPCLVVMQRPRHPLHIGVYVRGSVIHLTTNGARYQPLKLATQMFKTVRFVTC